MPASERHAGDCACQRCYQEFLDWRDQHDNLSKHKPGSPEGCPNARSHGGLGRLMRRDGAMVPFECKLCTYKAAPADVHGGLPAWKET